MLESEEKVEVPSEELAADLLGGGKFLDKLRPVERDILENATVRVIYDLLGRLYNTLMALIVEMEKRGVKLSHTLKFDRTRAGGVLTAMIEVQDINPSLYAANRKFFLRRAKDRWGKWIVTKILMEHLEDLIDESIEEIAKRELLLVQDLDRVEIVGRIPLEGKKEGENG